MRQSGTALKITLVAPDGEIRWEGSEIASDVKLVEAPKNAALTPALRFESWFLFAAAFAMAGDGYAARKRNSWKAARAGGQ